MRVALVNPAWDFAGSIYFGCRAPHLPLELGYAAAALRARGHDVLMIDGLIQSRTNDLLADDVAAFAPAMTVVLTAPTYLFWRCAPPELRTPRAFIDALAGRGGRVVVAGPHGSSTPGAVLRKLGADVVIRGECEDVIVALADAPDADLPGTARMMDEKLQLNGGLAATRFTDTPAIAWPDSWIGAHAHHHHRYDTEPHGPGAEVEASRGCPYSCSFCAKSDYRDAYRRRDLQPLLTEIDALAAQGVRYLYFIDEIFLPNRALLQALVARNLQFGVQTRIDLWKADMLELLGRAGCVSIEAGVESLTAEGRASLDKECRVTTEDLTARLIDARRHVPFVQANLIATPSDDLASIAEWRRTLQAHHVWANDPVPMFPYPSSPDYVRLFGRPDETAWERAHAHYLGEFGRMSDIQDAAPQPLSVLECGCG